MISAQEIQQVIAQQIECSYLKVDGDGHHWYAIIIAEYFADMSRIKRHQSVYNLLKEKLDSNELHALSLRTFTPAEWEKQPTKPA